MKPKKSKDNSTQKRVTKLQAHNSHDMLNAILELGSKFVITQPMVTQLKAELNK